MNKTINIEPCGDYNLIVVKVLENITVENIDLFEEELEDSTHIGKSFNVILDLSDVGFLVSRALGIIVKKYKHCINHRGNLVYCNPSDTVKKVMEITKINRVIKEFETLDEAKEFFKK